MYHLFLLCLLLSFSVYSNADQRTCLRVEREALLAFKHGIHKDPGGILSSWKGGDCCAWKGVECNNYSRGVQHVTRLDLGNQVEGIYLSGEISPQIGNLSKLEYLDLSHNDLKVKDWRWLGSLTWLVALNFSNNNQIDQIGEGLFQSTSKLPYLLELQLHGCGLSKLPDSLPYINFTSLSLLDLSWNNFNDPLPPWVFNLTSLVRLEVGFNSFGGVISDYDFSKFEALRFLSLHDINVRGPLSISLGSLCQLKELDLVGNKLTGTMNEFFQGFVDCPDGNSLTFLDLGYNQLEGEIPASIEKLKHLQSLNLEDNKLSGVIPQSSIGNLQELVTLDLGENQYEGFITEIMFLNLKKLEDFRISSNNVIFNMTLDWMPPFRLSNLFISNCHVGPKFPKWIQVQSNLISLLLRNVSISDRLPAKWISKMSRQLTYLELSQNQFIGELPERMYSPVQDGKIIPSTITLSHNNISGRVPSWICSSAILQLNNNQLSGPIPECFNDSSNVLRLLDLSHNDLSGTLSHSMFLSTHLKVLLLSNNHLHGRLPTSLQSSMGSLDVGENLLSGNLPTWPPASWALRLRSNFFHGSIPEHWCDNPTLHILDLADNNLSGPIPQCISNLTWLSHDLENKVIPEKFFDEVINEITKGVEMEYTKTTYLLNIIDLSRNNLSDGIPIGLMNLTHLGTLNLSMNHLSGKIPHNIGDMRLLETLDLSNNNLVGEIPQGISLITSLSHLNLSSNQLEGRIPSGTQLDTLNDDLSIYEGNPLLCGLPLPKKCHSDGEVSPGDESSNGEETEDGVKDLLWFLLFMGTGIVPGLCSICYVLWVSLSFRNALFGYFRLY